MVDEVHGEIFSHFKEDDKCHTRLPAVTQAAWRTPEMLAAVKNVAILISLSPA